MVVIIYEQGNFYIKMKYKNFINKATDGLLNDNFRQSFLVCVLSALLFFISVVAAVTHLIKDGDKTFGIIMSVLCVVCIAVFLLTLFVNKYQHIWRRVFMGLIILFFGYLCYDGGPDGFLHVWILLIPAFSFITFGLLEGFATAVPVFLVMIAFFWWPLADFRKYASEQAASQGGTPVYIDGDQIAVFSINLRIRLTLMYVVSMALGYFAELVRHIAAKRLRGYTENFKYASMHDSLTGLANQNFLAKFLDETYQNRTESTTLGCLFVDVDNFKGVNDTYGHLFGNVVLVRIAEILSEEKDAFVCRWGGDEYVVCLTNVDEDYLIRIGEKFRAAVSACKFKDYPDFHITVSVGVCVLPVDETFNFDHVLDIADYANRTAKSRGKDNVSVARKR